MVRPLRAPAVLVGLLLLGCGADEQSDPQPLAAPTYRTYVAMGDSYVAAPLVPRTDIADGCLRSDGNYPALLAEDLPGVRLVDVSCSGARTDSLTGPQQVRTGTRPPQLDALTADTDLVTVGIGGNDFGLFSTLVGTCMRLAPRDPQGAPCQAQSLRGGADQLLEQVAQVRDRIEDVVTQIRARSPQARVLAVGYPKLLPEEGTCPDRVGLAVGDYAYVDRVNKALTDAVRDGAIEAGAEYVDLYTASAGHDICSDDPWINGRTTFPAAALAYHPFAAEQAAVAEMILARL